MQGFKGLYVFRFFRHPKALGNVERRRDSRESPLTEGLGSMRRV